MKKIGILDYGAGNLNSIIKVLNKLNAKVIIIDEKNSFKNIDKLVIPGVGSFDSCIKYLKKRNMIQPLKNFVKNKPTLAICLGMQILMNKSEEGLDSKGLNILDGKVEMISKTNKTLQVPHIGWSKLIVENKTKNNFFKDFENKYFYYSNSYICKFNLNFSQSSFFNYRNYKFYSAIKKNNLIATQFHPEISGKQGFQFYKKFLELN